MCIVSDFVTHLKRCVKLARNKILIACVSNFTETRMMLLPVLLLQKENICVDSITVRS